MAYATTEQYRLLYDTSASDERLAAFLERASVKVDAELAAHGLSVPEDPDETVAAILADTVCDMVHRVLGDGMADMPAGATSYSFGGGGINEAYSFAVPYSDLMVRAGELDALMALLGSPRTGVGAYSWGAS